VNKKIASIAVSGNGLVCMAAVENNLNNMHCAVYLVIDKVKDSDG